MSLLAINPVWVVKSIVDDVTFGSYSKVVRPYILANEMFLSLESGATVPSGVLFEY